MAVVVVDVAVAAAVVDADEESGFTDFDSSRAAWLFAKPPVRLRTR